MEKIRIHGERTHTKASKKYVDVTFYYDDEEQWDGSIPIVCRRSGLELTKQSEIDHYLEEIYPYCHPCTYENWRVEQCNFWKPKTRVKETKDFFDGLITFQWTCAKCQLPNNPNGAKRIQDLKDFGYAIATYTHKQCNPSSVTFSEVNSEILTQWELSILLVQK
jgi:hypothetical protein